VRRNPLEILSGLIVVAAILTAGTAASARTESLRWYHPSPDEISGYRVHWGTGSRSYSSTINVGKLAANADGVVSYSLTVPDEQTVFVAVTAYDSDGDSPYSNEKVYQGLTAPTPPPPTSGTSDAAIDGFRLWNASNDTLLIDDFHSGDAINLATHGNCTAIEILGNLYLQRKGLTGSIRVSFDGAPGTCRNQVAPFAWETYSSGPGDFACAPSLTQPGNHTLRVTPFDGDSCTGRAGDTAEVTFQILDAAAPPPASAEPLGAPGRPMIVQ